MVAAGYLLKRVTPPPRWLVGGPTHIEEVCSIADCVNDNVVDVQGAWRHNGFGLANDADFLRRSAQFDSASGSRLFYYEAYQHELASDGWVFAADDWQPLSRAKSAVVDDDVQPEAAPMKLLGFDVVVFGDFLEHSPLSCNSVAKTLPVNRHCLFNTLQDALHAVNSGGFGGGCEDGIYKIFSVSLVEHLEERRRDAASQPHSDR